MTETNSAMIPGNNVYIPGCLPTGLEYPGFVAAQIQMSEQLETGILAQLCEQCLEVYADQSEAWSDTQKILFLVIRCDRNELFDTANELVELISRITGISVTKRVPGGYNTTCDCIGRSHESMKVA